MDYTSLHYFKKTYFQTSFGCIPKTNENTISQSEYSQILYVKSFLQMKTGLELDSYKNHRFFYEQQAPFDVKLFLVKSLSNINSMDVDDFFLFMRDFCDKDNSSKVLLLMNRFNRLNPVSYKELKVAFYNLSALLKGRLIKSS